ncbi:hypothetical protein OB919_02795 [Halobacteria archaeon AArc-curdl1]|uniref:Uncharacterized protein n=1 Tax=Natronosalvus hydrolyticus TaxID=2979988 RepID=A0AAP2Z670_9EURY|nr:hypothetical protein [Halobacteria archaeon AArc-curdl1]
MQSLDLATDATSTAFLDNPANYSDERSLAEETRQRLCSILPPTSVADVRVNESSGAAGDIPDHRQYTTKYERVDKIDRAQCEVGGPTFPFGGRERLDLAVLSDEIEMVIDGGTQTFSVDDLDAAVAFKYVKNINYLRYRPDGENSKYRDIADDISRLAEIEGDVDRRCIVYSNYDLFRRENDEKARSNLVELADQGDVTLRFVFPDPVQDKW